MKMPEEKTSPVYKFIKWLVRVFYPCTSVEGIENLPFDPCIVVGNHAQMNGPIACELYEESTKVTLFSEVPFTNLSIEDKLWACYMHACIMHVQGEQLTNSSLRARFGVPQSSSGSISRLIKEAVTAEIIKPLDPTTSNKYMKYIPFWA